MQHRFRFEVRGVRFDLQGDRVRPVSRVAVKANLHSAGLFSGAPIRHPEYNINRVLSAVAIIGAPIGELRTANCER